MYQEDKDLKVKLLEEENENLRKDNDQLQEIIDQLRKENLRLHRLFWDREDKEANWFE